MNNFGYGGANAHVIMENYPSFVSSQNRLTNGVNGHANGLTNGANGHKSGLTNGVNGHQTNGVSNGEAIELTNGHTHDGYNKGLTNGTNGHEIISHPKVIILSAKDETTTRAMAANLKDYLTKTAVEDESKFLENLAYTLGERRTRFPWVSAYPTQSVSSLLRAIESDKMTPARITESPRVGFVFTGQGAQWYAMGRELIEAYPVFKASLLEAEGYLKAFGSTFSVMGRFRIFSIAEYDH